LTKDSTVGEPRPVTIAREPGTAMSYSGGGYTILQLLIEEITNSNSRHLGAGPLYIDNNAGGHIVGHHGGTYPAWGAVMRVNPATGKYFDNGNQPLKNPCGE